MSGRRSGMARRCGPHAARFASGQGWFRRRQEEEPNRSSCPRKAVCTGLKAVAITPTPAVAVTPTTAPRHATTPHPSHCATADRTIHPTPPHHPTPDEEWLLLTARGCVTHTLPLAQAPGSLPDIHNSRATHKTAHTHTHTHTHTHLHTCHSCTFFCICFSYSRYQTCSVEYLK